MVCWIQLALTSPLFCLCVGRFAGEEKEEEEKEAGGMRNGCVSPHDNTALIGLQTLESTRQGAVSFACTMCFLAIKTVMAGSGV